MSVRDEYRRTALRYFMAAEEADDPDTVRRLLESAQGYMRSAVTETANFHVQAWLNKVPRASAL